MQTPRSVSLSSYFNRLRGVWILDESFFQVLDKASQSINNSWRNSKRQLVIFYANQDQVSNPPSRWGFPMFSLYELLMSLRIPVSNLREAFMADHH